jgi:hypothetical protein
MEERDRNTRVLHRCHVLCRTKADDTRDPAVIRKLKLMTWQSYTGSKRCL